MKVSGKWVRGTLEVYKAKKENQRKNLNKQEQTS